MSVLLPDPGRTHDRHHLAGVDGELDAAERLHFVVLAELVGLAQRRARRGDRRSVLRSVVMVVTRSAAP